ncbi:hypothetical protein [Thauera sp. SDU_THAU2]|uniref:hypothetical protein n=1 Tax=Thauera sp. SDU_THAU2 TaxID=3136633 RepID=UPI00311F762C
MRQLSADCCHSFGAASPAAEAEHLPMACRHEQPMYFVSCLSGDDSLNAGSESILTGHIAGLDGQKMG